MPRPLVHHKLWALIHMSKLRFDLKENIQSTFPFFTLFLYVIFLKATINRFSLFTHESFYSEYDCDFCRQHELDFKRISENSILKQKIMIYISYHNNRQSIIHIHSICININKQMKKIWIQLRNNLSLGFENCWKQETSSLSN